MAINTKNYFLQKKEEALSLKSKYEEEKQLFISMNPAPRSLLCQKHDSVDRYELSESLPIQWIKIDSRCEECLNESEENQRIAMLNVPKSYGKVSPFNDSNIEDLIVRGKGAIFIGLPDTGKSYRLFQISILFNSAIVKMLDLANKYRYEMEGRIQLTEELKTREILLIDDLGVESSSTHLDQAIYEIFDYRYDNQLPTFISTNLSASEIAGKYGDRIHNRFFERGANSDLGLFSGQIFLCKKIGGKYIYNIIKLQR